MRPLPSLLSFGALAGLAALFVFGGCNGQTEGQICDKRNGDGDCQNGYTCTVAPLPPGINGARCCPGNLALATTPACGMSQGGLDANSAPPVDASGNLADGAADASGDAVTEEASTDASGDASAEGGGDGGGEASSAGDTGATE
jgi:hypothetical protein